MSDERVVPEKRLPANEVALARRDLIRGDEYLDAYNDGYDNEYNYGYGKEDGDDDGMAILKELWRAAYKRKWLILTIVAIVTTIVGIEQSRIRPTYSASAIVEIRKDYNMSALIGSDLDPQNAITINTKMLLFESRPLLEDVVLKLKLDQNPKFVDVSLKRSWSETLKRMLSAEKPREQPEVQPAVISDPNITERMEAEPNKDLATPYQENRRLDPFVGVLRGGLKAERIPDTQALRITFRHTDPVIAQLVANGVTHSFRDRTFRSKTDKFSNTASWLDSSTRELQAKVEQSEQALANYTRDNDIFTTGSQGTLTNTKLQRLHEQATRSEMELIIKKSLYEEVMQGRVKSLPDSFTDAKLSALAARLNELSLQAAQLSVDYGPEHPQVRAVQEQMVEIQKQIDTGRTTLEEKIKADYERASREYEELRRALDQAKGEAVQQDQASIQYNILKSNLDIAKNLYTGFLQKTNQAKLEAVQQQNNVDIIQPAQVPRGADSPQHMLSMMLAFVLSLAFGIGLAFVIERFDNTIKSTEDVSRYAQLPTLGVIPEIITSTATARALSEKTKKKVKQLSIADDASSQSSESGDFHIRFLPSGDTNKKPNGGQLGFKPGQMIILDEHSTVAEAYRALRTSVLLSTAGRPPKTILMTSSQPGEGKTTTVINTAISLAQLGASVLIIDADLRKPTAHKGFGVKREQGLSTYLSGEVEVDALIQKLQIPNVSMIPCGPIPPNAAELISSEKMKELLQTLGNRYDHILLDSPPLMYVTDPVILSTIVDGVILIVHSGKSTRDVVRQSRKMLSAVGAKIFGVVLNNVDLRHQAYAYNGYYSDYDYQRVEERVTDILG